MVQITQTTDKPSPRARPPQQGPPALVQYYLLAYNVFATIGWSYVILLTCLHLAGTTPAPPVRSLASYLPPFVHSLASYLPPVHSLASYLPPVHSLASYLPPAVAAHLRSALGGGCPTYVIEKYLSPALVRILRRTCTTHKAVDTTTLFVQSTAVLEIVHAAAGWVRSSVRVTAPQVASRLYMVWGILPFFPHTRSDVFYTSMVLSWGAAEVVRYSFYAASFRGTPARAHLWARYSLFAVLYLTGAPSEAALIYESLPAPAPALPAWVPRPRVVAAFRGALAAPGSGAALHAAFRAGVYLVWWVALYSLYTYMLGQRRRVLGTGRALGARPKSL